MSASKPLVSVFCFSKDRAGSIRRCVESVLAQTYTHFELVIQDGASTDGTLEILRSYNDPRIKLVSEPDSGPAEAFWKVLQRCRGDIVSSCLSDEELLPHALQDAVDLFAKFPRVGAITRDGYVTDGSGKVTSEFIAGEFDFVDYLLGRYCPMFCASFFRRQALVEVGLKDEQWNVGCIEFEIWCRLGTRHSVKYVPGIVAKYGVDEKQQLSNTPKNFSEHLDSRSKVIEHLFSEGGFFGEDNVKKTGCLYNQHYLFYNHARAYKLYDSMEQIYHRMMAIERSISGEEASEYVRYFSRSSAPKMHQRARLFGRASRLWLQCSSRCPRFIKRSLSVKRKLAIRRAVLNAITELLALIPRPIPAAAPSHAGPTSDAIHGLGDPEYSKRIYHDVASIYYGRGAIDYALFLWRKAEELDDVIIDSVAVQAALLSPSATNEGLLAGQRRWAERHAKPLDRIGSLSPKPFDGHRKIRIGYYCSFFDGDVVRAMFAPVVQHHDRERFTAIAYSVTPAARHMEGSFDEFKVTGMMPDRDFVKRVRDDEIDIFVEMSGFSPFNRFAAMASRCAPIQIAHFNHSGTCGVRNVDYVFADAMSVTPEDEKYYSEKVWRLDGDFLFFNYEWAQLPEPRDPPCLKNGYVTFGCFGSAGKLSDQTIEMWAAILDQVPNSRIYIRNGPLGPKVNRDFLAQRFARYGIPSSRLRLEGATDWKLFIGSYAEVDISFDTWPYCGANTIGESVWQGVPVITLRGDRFSSRYGSSHVAAAGTPELIAHTPERYIALAAELSAKPERILYYRRNLRRMAKEHGLSDPSRFARKLEKAYLEMMYLLHERATDRRAAAGVTASAA